MTTLGDKSVGSSIYLNINGTSREFIIIHQGTPSTDYGGDCSGTWVLMKDLYEKRALHSNYDTNIYANLNIHSYLNSTFLNLLDSNIQSSVKTIKIPYTTNNLYVGYVNKGENGLLTQVFLLSYTEVGFTADSNINSAGANAEGAALEYFNGAADSKRIAYLDGTAIEWFLRTPYIGNNYTMWAVGPSGTPYMRNVKQAYGIRPALVLDSSLIVGTDGNLKKALKGYNNIDGTWKETDSGYAHIGGAWRELTLAYKNIDGTWKE